MKPSHEFVIQFFSSSFFSRDEVSLLHVFFKSEFIVQYKRDQLYGIEDLVCKSGFAIFAHKMGKKYLGQKTPETCHSFTVQCTKIDNFFVTYTLISLINVEVGINVEGGIFWKKPVHNSNKRGVEGGKI